MCGDDRVRGTREQMLLMQVEPVRLSIGARGKLESFIYFVLCRVELFCKLL